MPLILRAKKVVLFIALHITALAVVYFLHWLYFSLFITHIHFNPVNFFIYNIFTYFFILASSTAYFMLLERQHNAKLIQERETENLKQSFYF